MLNMFIFLQFFPFSMKKRDILSEVIFQVLIHNLKTGKIPNRQRSASNDKMPGDEASISKAAEVSIL